MVIISTVFAILFFLYATYSLNGSVAGAFSRWTSLLYVFIASVSGAILVYSILQIAKKHLWGERYSGSNFLYRMLICILIFPIIAGIFILPYRSIFFSGISWAEILETWTDLVPRSIVISIFTGIVYAITDHSLEAYLGLQQVQVEAKRLRTQQMNLRFESLRNQISPHFLFNSLNTISSLIQRDPRTADTFIRHLARLYSSVMKHYNSHTIALREELELVRDYGYLMQTRFENAFSLELDTNLTTNSFRVPPLSVQILVENAVKHNQMNLKNPLKVNVYIDKDYLVVRNNYIGEPEHVTLGNDLLKKPGKHHTGGLGLMNIENRYGFLTKKKIVIRKDDFFTVSIPLLTEDDEKAIHG